MTGPGGEKLPAKKAGVHPNTNYNAQISRSGSPDTSESEDMGDIRRAQKLSINISPIDTEIPHRMVRTIIRGDFPKIQQEAKEGSRRLRTYLVATDLSGEAAYALEWTIGTVLRDGDTLLAVYAVDEESTTGKVNDSDSTNSLPIGEGGTSMHETTAAIGRLTEASTHRLSTHVHSPLASLKSESKSISSRRSSADSRFLPRAEQERYHAIEDITQTCLKFLRKTKLQVRIAVEVVYCKSSKYMITEAVSWALLFENKNLRLTLLDRRPRAYARSSRFTGPKRPQRVNKP